MLPFDSLCLCSDMQAKEGVSYPIHYPSCCQPDPVLTLQGCAQLGLHKQVPTQLHMLLPHSLLYMYA